MAIGFDNSGNGSTGWSGSSWTHICTGSNLFLAVGIATYSASLRTVTGITYNSVALTKANSITANLESNFQDSELWYLDAPASGTHTVSVSYSGAPDFASGLSVSYTGKTTTGVDATNATQATSASTNSPACNVNVVHNDCWLIGWAYSRDSTPSAGTGTTGRQTQQVGHIFGDSNGVVGTGNQTLAFTTGSAVTWPGICSISISEANAGGGGATITPGSGALTLTGQAPTVTATQNHWTQPGSGALTITGFAPTVTVPSNVVAKPSSGALTITGHAPNRVVDTALKPSSGALTITGHAPTVSITANQTVQPSSGALTLTGQAPTVTVTQNVFSNPLTGALVINGFAPTATVASQSPTISPATASLILQAFAPSVTVTGQTERALGGRGKRYPVGNLDLATWRKTRRLEARVEKLQKQIQEKRDRIDRTESFRQIEALKKQIVKLQKIILELLAQIDMLRKEDDEVEEVINVVRAVMAYRMRQ